MNRREALRALVVASGGLVALPSWALGWDPDRLALPAAASALSPSDASTLAAVADTIIPEGDGVGALALGVDRFLLRLLEACYDEGVQENVRVMLRHLDATARAATGAPFRECGREVRERLLLTLEATDDPARRDTFALLKAETIRGFRTSRVVMERLGYNPMPGFYDGCADALTP
jgi:hypothetical protein